MRCIVRILTAAAALAALSTPALGAPPKVVTTTEDLASLVREIGGDKVSVEAIARVIWPVGISRICTPTEASRYPALPG